MNKTMILSEAIAKLEAMMSQHGNLPVVLYDLDSGQYFSLTEDNFEFQQMADGSIRVSIGVNRYWDDMEEEPCKRPI